MPARAAACSIERSRSLRVMVPAAGSTLEREPARFSKEPETISSAQLEELRMLAESGYVRGLRERMDALEQETPALVPVLLPLRELLASYRLDAFQAALADARVAP